jgi:GntR family transcriptional regulator of arabinose operon
LGNDTRTKHVQVYRYLRDQIDSGIYRPGQRMPTESELVDQLGVSRPTVSRALGILEQEGQVVRRRGAGTFLATERGYLFGLMIPRLHHDGIGGPIANGIARRAEALGHGVLLASSLPDGDEESDQWGDRVCEQLIRHQVRAVFFIPLELHEHQTATNQQIAARIVQAGITLVLIDRDTCPFPDRSDFDLVAMDNRRAGFQMTQVLLQRGCQRLAFITDHPESSSALERLDGCRFALRQAGLSLPDARFVYWNPDADESLIKAVRSARPDGLIFINDLLASNGLRALQGAGMNVPADLRVVTFDDTNAATSAPVPLTTYRQPFEAIGVNAVDLMMSRMLDPEQHARDLRLAGEVVIRESCGSA